MTASPRRARQRRLLLALTVCLVAVGGGTAAAQSVSPAPSLAVDPDASPGLAEELAQAKAELAKAQAKADGLQNLLDALDEDYDAMEAQRQLLLELRKDLPDARDDAEAYLDKIQRLANRADASRLGQFASRMLETAPTFLTWRDEAFASAAEREAAFITSGATGFTTDFTELKDAVLLSVANRLDAILSLRDRIR